MKRFALFALFGVMLLYFTGCAGSGRELQLALGPAVTLNAPEDSTLAGVNELDEGTSTYVQFAYRFKPRYAAGVRLNQGVTDYSVTSLDFIGKVYLTRNENALQEGKPEYDDGLVLTLAFSPTRFNWSGDQPKGRMAIVPSFGYETSVLGGGVTLFGDAGASFKLGGEASGYEQLLLKGGLQIPLTF